MKKFFKKHIGLVILLAIIIAFPASMSTQARLNMRIIITGLAIDKKDNGYEVTAQIVKTAPGSGSEKSGSTIDFVSDTGDTIASAIAKLSYKSGKVAGFSHTNFVLVGKEMLDEDLVQSLNYFLRDNIIKDSVLLLVAKESAKDEIKNTKELGLSVGLEIQKVFVYKEKESDGAMTSLVSFVNKSLNHSKTSVVSVLSMTGEQSQSEQSSSGSSGSQSSGESGEQSGGDSSSSGSSGSQSSKNESKFFESITPLACFVSGKFVGSLEKEEEILGYMYAQKKCIAEDISLENLNFGNLKNAKVGIDVKFKKSSKKIRYEQGVPCLDICIKISNASIKEIQNENFINGVSNEEFEFIKSELEKKISQTIATSFEKSKELNADIFGAFDLANKFDYSQTKKNFETMEEFLKALKLNVEVEAKRLEY